MGENFVKCQKFYVHMGQGGSYKMALEFEFIYIMLFQNRLL